jgi:hypothetical protein
MQRRAWLIGVVYATVPKSVAIKTAISRLEMQLHCPWHGACISIAGCQSMCAVEAVQHRSWNRPSLVREASFLGRCILEASARTRHYPQRAIRQQRQVDLAKQVFVGEATRPRFQHLCARAVQVQPTLSIREVVVAPIAVPVRAPCFISRLEQPSGAFGCQVLQCRWCGEKSRQTASRIAGRRAYSSNAACGRSLRHTTGCNRCADGPPSRRAMDLACSHAVRRCPTSQGGRMPRATV